jgi:adenylosuccinate lyase
VDRGPRRRDLGIALPDGVVEAYEKVVDQVDLASIAARERVTRHDVKARIEEFNALAGHEQVHKGMTSRDLTENVEQLQVRASLELVRARVVAALARLGRLASEHEATVMAGRSHNVAAQATTLGKRFATVADELLAALARLEELLTRYPLRGIKGRGHRQDMLDLLDGDAASSRPSSSGSPRTSASTTCSPPWVRSTPARSTSTWSPRWCRWSPDRRTSPRRSG